jgi:hypothetical protein
MLNPNERILYLAQLTPPAGYQLDRALATTFTLDLLALLAAPVSMAGLEVAGAASALGDPIRLLEALRRSADRFVIFCQQGRIAIPKRSTPLFGLLEKAVVEVRRPNETGVFHPKVWVLRFVSDTGSVLYRVLCMSRNLTFDHSWDTTLCLEGALEDRQRGFGVNWPLLDFIAGLSSLAVREQGDAAAETVRLIASEVGKVRFASPDGFDPEFSFLPLGARGRRKGLNLGDFSRAMIVSPFLTEEGVLPLTSQGRGNVLVSRSDQLDSLPDSVVAAVEQRGTIYTMDDAVAWPETGPDDEAEPTSVTSGLHAKLYLTEQGRNVTLLTGSANATSAAWHRNVEFMVQLQGRKSQIGINKLLGDPADKLSLIKLLQPYQRGVIDEGEVAKRQAELELQAVAERVLQLGLYTEVWEEDAFGLVLKGEQDFSEQAKVLCRPVTLPVEAAQPLVVCAGEGPTFPRVSSANLTSFWAFSIELGEQSLNFVLNLPVRNMPDDRDRHILRAIIDDREKFLRYLMFLLADDQNSSSLQIGNPRGLSGRNAGYDLQIPVLEELLRAASRTPDRLIGLAELVDELMQSESGRQVLPEGFERIWPTLWAACQSGVS